MYNVVTVCCDALTPIFTWKTRRHRTIERTDGLIRKIDLTY